MNGRWRFRAVAPDSAMQRDLSVEKFLELLSTELHLQFLDFVEVYHDQRASTIIRSQQSSISFGTLTEPSWPFSEDAMVRGTIDTAELVISPPSEVPINRLYVPINRLYVRRSLILLVDAKSRMHRGSVLLLRRSQSQGSF